MLLGIFDTFHINEYHGSVRDLTSIIITAVLSGIVAFGAASFQIWARICEAKKQQKIEDQKDRVYLKQLIDNTLQELNNNKILLEKNCKPEVFNKDYDSKSYYKLFNYSSTKILSLDNSQTFNVLLPNKQSEVNIKLYANFLVAVDLAEKSVSLSETDLKNHDDKNSKLHKAIIDVYDQLADKINQVNRNDPDSNSVFNINNENGKKIQKSFDLMIKNPEINPLVFINDVVNFIISNIEEDRVYDRKYGAYEKYFIPLKTLLVQVLDNNTSLNTKIGQRIIELGNSIEKIEKFQKILK